MTNTEPLFDLWDDKNEPNVAYNQTVYTVTIPWQVRSEIPTGQVPFVYVGVDQYGMVEIVSYSWFGKYSSEGKEWEVQREIIDWLVEWELAEWRSIGPEDSELFATHKLMATKIPSYLASE